MSRLCGITFFFYIFHSLAFIGGCTLQSDDPTTSLPSSGYRSNEYKKRNDDSDAAILRGARLFDQWFSPVKPPLERNPMKNVSGLSIPESWRCVTCHGWNGGKGSNLVQRSLFEAYTFRDEPELFRTIKLGFSNATEDEDHKFRDRLSDEEIYDLVFFIKNGMKYQETYIPAPLNGVKATGNTVEGKYWYNFSGGSRGCADSNCHGEDGNGVLGKDNAIVAIGSLAVKDPWRFLYIARFGPAYDSNGKTVDDHIAAEKFPEAGDKMDEILGSILSYVQNSLPSTDIGGDPVRGGRLYDDYFKEGNITTLPTDFNPLWTDKRLIDTDESNTVTASESWRCVTCHGWDYKGSDGAFGLKKNSGYYSGFPGLLDASKRLSDNLAQQFVDTILNGYVELNPPKTYHNFSSGNYLNEQDAKDLAAFILTELVDVDDYFTKIVNQTYGDVARGDASFNNSESVVCSACHTANISPVGGLAWENRLKAFHRIRFGVPGNVEMVSAIKYGYSPAMVMDLLAYIMAKQ